MAKRKDMREQLVELVRGHVDWLVAKQDADGLAELLDAAGYNQNRGDVTCAQLGAAVLALLAVIPPRALRVTAAVSREASERDGRRPA